MIAKSLVDVWCLTNENDPEVNTCHLRFLPAVEEGKRTLAQCFKAFCSHSLTLLILGSH